MFNRKQHMNGECSHREYYAQFAGIFRAAVASQFKPEFLRERLAEDEHLNNIPMMYWDRWSEIYKSEYAKINEGLNGSRSWSLAGGVCAAKEAAKQIAEEI